MSARSSRRDVEGRFPSALASFLSPGFSSESLATSFFCDAARRAWNRPIISFFFSGSRRLHRSLISFIRSGSGRPQPAPIRPRPGPMPMRPGPGPPRPPLIALIRSGEGRPRPSFVASVAPGFPLPRRPRVAGGFLSSSLDASFFASWRRAIASRISPRSLLIFESCPFASSRSDDLWARAG